MHVKKLIIFIACLFISNICYADSGVHVGDRILTQYEFIERLIPKLKIKTRGVRLNEVQLQPTISMEIKFEFDSAKLTQHSINQLKPLGKALKSNELKDFNFLLEGHTDASGPEHYNLSLSQRRAMAVGQHLYSSFGVAPNRLKLIGKGEQELLQPGSPYSGVNRRVAITTMEVNS